MSDIRRPRTDLLFITNDKCQHEICEAKNVKFALKKDFSSKFYLNQTKLT